jgi:hypothetical protein
MWKRTTFRDLTGWGQVLYGAGVAALGFLILATLMLGTSAATIAACFLLLLFVFSAPFVIAGRWRTPESRPVRRPVVRRRRS